MAANQKNSKKRSLIAFYMNNHRPRSFRSSLAICVLLSFCIGCKTTHVAKKAAVNIKSPEALLEKLEQNQFDFEWFGAKLSAKTTIEGRKIDVTLKLRIRKDSAIWMSVSPALGIEMARVLITQDSVKFINRFEKAYHAGPISYLSYLAPVEMDLLVLQSILLGNAASIMEKKEGDTFEFFRASANKGHFLLKKTEKKTPRITASGTKLEPESGNKVWLDPVNFKIVKSEINGNKSTKKIITSYSDFKIIGEILFGHKIELTIKGDEPVTVSAQYSKVVLNEALKLPYSVPAKYRPYYSSDKVFDE